MNQGTITRTNRNAAVQFWSRFTQSQPIPDEASNLVDGYAGKRLRLALFRHTPHVLTDEHVAQDHRRAALLSLQLEGESRIEQHGRHCTVSAGDFCLLDLSQPFRLETGRSEVQTIYLPLAMLRETVPEMEQASATPLHGHLGPTGYLRSLYEEIFTRAPQLTEPVADRLLEAIPHMFAAALEGISLGQDPTVGSLPSSQLRQHYKHSVKRFVREHLSDPGLCIERIASGVGLSASYLFELFADEEITLMRWVRRERLARCRRELEDPAARRKSIAQVAYRWGFGDLAHFSRSFREAFGMSPRAYRQLSLFGPAR